MFWLMVCLTTIFTAILYWLIKPLYYWADLGVKQDDLWSLLILNWGTLIKKQSFASFVQELYKTHSKVRYIGTYQLNKPTLLIKDPDLIKMVTVKDFDHFTDHRAFIPEDADPMWAKNLFALTGKRWRDMRATLSPCFTSAKMKIMFGLIVESSKDFVEYFKNADQGYGVEIELKDTFTRFANDIVATTAFGIKIDSLKDKTNEFYLMGRKLTDQTKICRMAKLMTFLIFPKIAELLKISFFEDDIKSFFVNLVKEAIRIRQEQKIFRPDVIHLLMEARMKQDEVEVEKMTDEDIAAQAMIFFFAGFDTVSSLMTFLGYELAVNPEIQERLRKEIQKTLNGQDQLTYDDLMNMKYLDMVVSETLRKWPINVAVDRVCTKPYTIKSTRPDELDLHLPLDSVIWLPIYGIHRDPDFYPDPEKFDPERFSDENKSSINPYTYLPFGQGPRNCLGSRLALMEIKTVFCYILNNFEIVPCEKSVIPVKLSPKQYILNADNGFWCRLKRLEDLEN